MKYEILHQQAKQIDRLIDDHSPFKTASFISHEELIALILHSFPDFYVENCGWHKIVFSNRQVDHQVVLKVGPQRSIESDHSAYKIVPHSVRHQFFARIFWHTKYCLLQEYGAPAKVTPQQLSELRCSVNRYGVFDVKADNLRAVNGVIKIVDANVTRLRMPTMLRVVDEAKERLPEKLHLWIKKATKRLNEK